MKGTAVSPDVHPESAVRAEIADLRARVPDITGALVATVDGLPVAHDLRDVHAETLAAMSAAQLGLGRQFAHSAAHGEFLESVTRSAGGCLAVFAAGDHGLLTVLAGADLNLGRRYHEARPAAVRLGVLLIPEEAGTDRPHTPGR
jgi:predicted regulator of Ras-like GTPase activity (Roadblock/LC7/MglB family)